MLRGITVNTVPLRSCFRNASPQVQPCLSTTSRFPRTLHERSPSLWRLCNDSVCQISAFSTGAGRDTRSVTRNIHRKRPSDMQTGSGSLRLQSGFTDNATRVIRISCHRMALKMHLEALFKRAGITGVSLDMHRRRQWTKSLISHREKLFMVFSRANGNHLCCFARFPDAVQAEKAIPIIERYTLFGEPIKANLYYDFSEEYLSKN